jgi:hypothetical protein
MSEEKKLFGRHHDLFLLLVGFFFTSILGATLGYYFQNRSWDFQERARLVASEREAATKVFEEVSRLMDKRIYRMRQLNWKLSGDNQADTELQMDLYRKILYEWNDSLNRNRAMVQRYFGSGVGEELFGSENRNDPPDNIHHSFKTIGKSLESYYSERDTNGNEAEKEIDSSLEKLEERVYNINIRMIALIQKGEVGAFRPEFK